MRPRRPEGESSEDLFRARLSSQLDLKHALVRLAEVIDWERFETAFGPLYHEATGRPGKPTRLMVGLTYLKHTYNLSDEAVCERWVENPYWQFFCGFDYLQHRLPVDPSSLTRWRERIGASGMELLLAATVEAALAAGAAKPASLERVTVDTTVQPKAIAHPVDSRLYNRGREILVRLAARHGLRLRQSYQRLAKRALRLANRYAHARQMRRARREIKRLKTFLGRVARDVARKLADRPALAARFERPLALVDRLLAQQKSDRGKLYSLHAPEVECLAKGKAHKRYEFGVKVSVAATNREGLVLGMLALPGNPYDAHTLAPALAQVERLTGVVVARGYVDRGYRGHRLTERHVFIAGQRRGLTPTIKRELKRRSAIEPVIGHMKNDGRLGRNFLAGSIGDAINALLCGAGYNLRLILNYLAALLRALLQALAVNRSIARSA
ncbi:MAG TPA: IS5 family transposase, partial [Sphingomonas sp.]|nr:IS5 family transposase [Sphingomonas sp.]